jgi:hypothetical protein
MQTGIFTYTSRTAYNMVEKAVGYDTKMADVKGGIKGDH